MGARVVFALTEKQVQVLDTLRAQRSLAYGPDLSRAFDVLRGRGLVSGNYPSPAALTEPGRHAADMLAALPSVPPAARG